MRYLRTLTVLMLLGSTAACAPTPPPNLYNDGQTKAYKTENAEQAVIALSQVAINLNTATPQRLTDADTRLVRDFALAFDAWRVDYVNGAAPPQVVKDLFAKLQGQLTSAATTTTLKAVLASLAVAVQAL